MKTQKVIDSDIIRAKKPLFYYLNTLLKRNQVFIAIIAFLYILPLFTSTTFSSERALLFTMTELMIFGILALSFAFQLGRAGLLNFGQAAFFGLGAYTMVFFLKPSILPTPLDEIFSLPNQLGVSLGVIDRIIPISFLIPLICAILVGIILGAIMGATTNRMKGTAFAFIALAIAMVIFEIFNMQGMQKISGGETGQSIGASNPFFLYDWIFYLILVFFAFVIIIIFFIMIFLDLKQRKHFIAVGIGVKKSALEYKETDKDSNFRIAISMLIPITFLVILVIAVLPNIWEMYTKGEAVHFQKPNTYYVILSSSIMCYIFVKIVANSPFGRILSAIAQNEDRVEALGYNVFIYRIIAVAMSGGMAALAGALFVPFKIVVDPVITVGIDQTIDAMLYSIIGGFGTILGPFLGAGLVRFSEQRLVEVLDAFSIPGQLWLVILGFIYVLIVLFFPWGIVGSIKLRAHKIKGFLEKGVTVGRLNISIKENDYWWLAFLTMPILFILMLNMTEENIRSFIEMILGLFG